MHGLPTDLDLSPFVGTTLDTVTFAMYTVHFVFESDSLSSTTEPYRCSISTTALYTYRLYANAESVAEEVPLKHSSAMQLTGASVVAVNREGKGTLVLTLDQGRELKIIEDDRPYECYTLAIKGEEVFV